MVIARLSELRDDAFGDFTARLLPGVKRELIIGVRTPQLRVLAREMLRNGTAADFMEQLPHHFFEENLLHSLLLSQMRLPVEELLVRVERFLPFVDNWAVCDQLRPKLFAKHPREVYAYVSRWLQSEQVYMRRYGMVASMIYFLDDNFEERMIGDVARVPAEEYYVMMAVAWYFSFALVKQWNSALPFIEQRRLPRVVHNKAIQKAVESLRLSAEQKEFLRSLRWK